MERFGISVRCFNKGTIKFQRCKNIGSERRATTEDLIEAIESVERHRWVVERTYAWLNRFRRLSVCYGRRADIFLAFNILSCALVCFNQIRRFC